MKTNIFFKFVLSTIHILSKTIPTVPTVYVALGSDISPPKLTTAPSGAGGGGPVQTK